MSGRDSGTDWYTAETSYSPFGEVLRTVSGEHPSRVWTTNLFDESTGELTRSIVDRESTSDTTAVMGNRVNSRTYAYDPAGNVTSIADRANEVTDRQCFSYDTLGQLTEAWTAPRTTCTAEGRAAAAPRYSDGTLNVTGANAGYWTSYRYDAVGNRETLVEHDTGGDSSKDATTSYTYGAPDGTQPHTLTGMSATRTTPEGAQVTTEASATYDASGNTRTRSADGDEQALTWTWDGQVETVTGFGENGAGAWLGLTDKCLDLSGGSTVVGTAVQLYSCNGSKPQKFRIDAPAGASDAATGALKVLGVCVVPAGGATAVGTKAVVAECTGAANQRWTATSEGTLKHVESGLCLDVPDSNSASGTDLWLYTCNSSDAQIWTPDKETRYTPVRSRRASSRSVTTWTRAVPRAPSWATTRGSSPRPPPPTSRRARWRCPSRPVRGRCSPPRVRRRGRSSTCGVVPVESVPQPPGSGDPAHPDVTGRGGGRGGTAASGGAGAGPGLTLASRRASVASRQGPGRRGRRLAQQPLAERAARGAYDHPAEGLQPDQLHAQGDRGPGVLRGTAVLHPAVEHVEAVGVDHDAGPGDQGQVLAGHGHVYTQGVLRDHGLGEVERHRAERHRQLQPPRHHPTPRALDRPAVHLCDADDVLDLRTGHARRRRYGGQVGGERGQFAQRAGRQGGLQALVQLLGGQQAVARRDAEDVDDSVAVGVGGA